MSDDPMIKPKPYIELRDFPSLTPFTEQAIRGHMQRGALVEGVHFFRIGRRVIFKWDAIVAWIEKKPIPTPVAAENAPQPEAPAGPENKD